MKTFSTLARLLVCLSPFLAIDGCDENSPVDPAGVIQVAQPDAEALQTFFASGIKNRTQNFLVNASTGGEIKGSEGTMIRFFTGAFLEEDGDAVTGYVEVSLIEVYDRASMVITSKPTNGKDGDGNISTMVSGGEFYVNAAKDGVALKSGGFQIVAPTDNTGGIDQDMKMFDGLENCDGDVCDVVWEQVKDRGMEIGEFQTTGGFETGYYVWQSKFGWTNIDRWYNDPRPKTTIFVDVPAGYDNSNCAVFIAYDGEPTALGRFDKYDETKGMFTEHYGLIPVGLNVHIILISVIDDKIHYAIQGTTIVENHIEVIGDVKSVTEQELIDLIGELP